MHVCLKPAAQIIFSIRIFNLYISKIPHPPDTVKLVTYADDCSILSTGQNIAELEERLNEYLPRLVDFMEGKNLKLSAPKSSSSLFTTWDVEMKARLDINIRGALITNVPNPKILETVLDSSLKSVKQAEKVSKKLKGRNRILWRKSKETIATTYKAIGRSIIDYAAAV